LALDRGNRYLSGERMDGLHLWAEEGGPMITMVELLVIQIEIRMSVDGSSGIVAIGLVGVFRPLTKYKFRDGALSVVIAAVFMRDALPGRRIRIVVFENARRFSNGRTIPFSRDLCNPPTISSPRADIGMYIGMVLLS
jgi:hypothetical protein